MEMHVYVDPKLIALLFAMWILTASLAAADEPG